MDTTESTSSTAIAPEVAYEGKLFREGDGSIVKVLKYGIVRLGPTYERVLFCQAWNGNNVEGAVFFKHLRYGNVESLDWIE